MKNLLKKAVLLIMSIAIIFCGVIMVGKVTVKAAQADESASVEKIADVYLIAGQSNAVGSTLIAGGAGPSYKEQNDESYADPFIRYSNVLYNHHAHPTTKGSGYIITDFVPVTQRLGYTTDHIGPELGMAEYLDPIYAQKENTDAIIIKVAAGGTKLTHHYDDANIDIEELRQTDSYDATFGTWYPESLWNVTSGGLSVDLWDVQYYRHPTGLLYRELINFIRENYKLLQEKGYTQINFKALCWMQGESDRGNESDYKVAFSAFMGDLRARLTEITEEDYSSFPVVCGEISKTFANVSQISANEKFIQMQHEIAYNLDQTYVIPTSSFLIHNYDENGHDVTLGSDSSHWNYEDMVDIGYMFGEKAYNVRSTDKWIYFNTTASRNDRYDKTTLTDVEFDIGKFNDSGKLYFSCNLSTVYNITSLKIKNGEDLLPYLKQTVEDNVRKYTLDGVSVNNSSDIELQAHFENATAYNVTVSIATEGNGYGSKIYTYKNKVYENAGAYELETHPATDGRVYKVTINGMEVEGAKNKQTVVIDDIFDYLNGEDSFNIVVQYSIIPQPRIEASGYTSEFEVGEPFTTGGLVVKYLDSLDNETVISKEDYSVDSSTFNSSKAGEYLITIKSGSYRCTYTVSVIAPTLEIENEKEIFIIGEEFSLGNADIYIVTKAGRNKIGIEQCAVFPGLFNSEFAGEYNIIVTSVYNGVTVSGSYKVDVVNIDSITVSGAKTEFGGEEFSVGNIKVTAIVNGAEIELDETQYRVDSKNFAQNKNGKYTIKVTAAGKSATYEVTVSGVKAAGGCAQNAMDILGLVAGLCAIAFVFKKIK